MGNITRDLYKHAKDIAAFINKLKEKSVTCQRTMDYTNELLNVMAKLIDALEDKVREVNDPPLVKDLRAQFANIPRPLRAVLIALKHLEPDDIVEYDHPLDTEDKQYLKSEMNMLQAELAKMQTENAGLMAEIALLEKDGKMPTGSLEYRLALQRQQYEDRIAELELSIEEVLKQAEDELKQAFLEIKQMQHAQSEERTDWTEELETVCALTDELAAKLRAKDDELSSTKADYEKRILMLEISNEELEAELEASKSDLESLRNQAEKEIQLRDSEMDTSEEKARKEKSRAALLEDAKKEAKDESDRLRKKLLTVQGDLTKLKHRSKLDAEEAQQKIKSLQGKIDAGDERGTARATEINELKKRLKRQEAEMATESRIGAKMSEKIIERLQKKVKDQDKKIKDIGKYSDTVAEKLELETEVAALQKSLRAKEVE